MALWLKFCTEFETGILFETAATKDLFGEFQFTFDFQSENLGMQKQEGYV